MEAFNVYDKEGNGMILSGEIVHLLMSLGDKMKRPQVEEILSKTAKIDEEDYMKYEGAQCFFSHTPTNQK